MNWTTGFAPRPVSRAPFSDHTASYSNRIKVLLDPGLAVTGAMLAGPPPVR
jgi:hypothetical protein